MSTVVASGSCQCGGVHFEVHGPLRDVIACHCTQCRKLSGHYTAATATRPEHLAFIEQSTLKWYRASDSARRGFCAECGSTLFWAPVLGDRISIYAGAFDGPIGVELAAHIYVADKADYYHLDGDAELPQFAGTGADLSVMSC